MDIGSWLAHLGLDKYIEAFEANEVDFAALRHLSDDDLREMGLPLGPRRKVLAAVSTLDADVGSPAASAPSPMSAAPARDAERRQLTVVFIDLVGSTELSQRLDPEEMSDVFRAYQSAVSAEIARYEGFVAKLMGDGVLAYFGWPTAHEDDAERAVRASLAAAAATARLTTPAGEPLAARIGIATGLVVVGDLVGEGAAQEEAVVGETPNLAARLQTLAEPDTVVIGAGTHRLVAGLFEMIDLGQRPLKGFAVPIRAWRIAGEADTEGRFDALHGVATPLVGRVEELDLVLQRWQQVRAGRGQAILLSGEPGIGKSRLIAAVEERLAAGPHARFRYFCSPYHLNSALHPVIRQLERAAGLLRGDSADTRLDKLEAFLRQAGSEVERTGPLMAELLSIDAAGRHAPLQLPPQARKARTLTALVRLIKAFAASQPVVMIVEDAHWIDPTTSEWLDQLIDELQDARILLVVTFRPEFQPRWTLFSYVTALSLSRLDRDEGSAIVDRVSGGKPLPADVKNQILAKTEGVPLFVEELTKTVIESGLITDAGNRFVLSGPLPPLAIPSTLHDSLMARLDRLAPVKEIAQVGACIGRTFQHQLVAAVSGYDEARLEDVLLQLEKAELVFRRGVPPDAAYTFKHALVQDTAYQSLLKSRRQHIHARIASALEQQFPESAEAEPEALAHHYTAAALAEPAVGYWLRAGQQALKRFANREALAHLGKGLELVESLPQGEPRLRQEIHLQTAMSVTMMSVGGWSAPEVLEACTRARVLCEKLGDTRQLFVALCGESTYHMISGNLGAADELAGRCLDLAIASGDESLLLEAHHRNWSTKLNMGDYAASDYHAGQGIATYDPDRHHALTYVYTGHDPGVCCRNHSAKSLWVRGYPDRALERCREAIAMADRVSHPFSKALALQMLSYIHLMRREPAEVRLCLDAWLPLAQEFGLELSAGDARFQLGWTLALEGRAGEGLVEMREGLAAITATGAAVNLQEYFCVMARTCGECGDTVEGLELIERSLGVAEAGARYRLPDLLCTKGELLMRQDPQDAAAEGWFRQAVTLARDEGTKSLELRAAVGLARLLRERGSDSEARELLAPIFGWFTEGLDTRDLVDAREFLSR